MGAFRQFRLLLWKNFLLQKRRPIATIFEIVVPVFLVIVLLLLRIYEINEYIHPKYTWPAFNVLDIPIDKHKYKTWTVAYTPNNSETDEIMTRMTSFLNGVNVTSFPDEESLLDNVVSDEERKIELQTYLGGVTFLSNPGSREIRYKIRLPASPRNPVNTRRNMFLPQKWYTEFVYPFAFNGLGPRNNNSKYDGPPSYYREGFLSLQKAIDSAVIQMKNESFTPSSLKLSMKRFPYPRHIVDPFIVVIQGTFPMLIMLALVYTALSIVKNIVYEKEKRLKVG